MPTTTTLVPKNPYELVNVDSNSAALAAGNLATFSTDPYGNGLGIVGPAGTNIPIVKGYVTIGVLGDSIVQDNFTVPLTTSNNAGNSANFINWACAYAFGRLKYTAAAAQGGWTIDDINNNFNAKYLPYLPDITIVQIGFNDISGVTSDGDPTNKNVIFRTKLIALLGRLKSLGTLPVLCTISPKAVTMAGFTNVSQKYVYLHNAWARAYAEANHILLFDYANYVVDPADASGGLMQSLFQSNHVHGGSEINRALGFELWTNCISKLCPTGPILNYSIFNQTISGGDVGVNQFSNPMLTGTTGVVAGPATGTLPTGMNSLNSTTGCVYSIVANTSVALSSLNTTTVAGGGNPGNWAQCSIDTNQVNVLYTSGNPVGVSIAGNFQGGGFWTLPQSFVVRVRVKATALANCAGIMLRFNGGLGGWFFMAADGQGIVPNIDPRNNVSTVYDVLYETPPFTIPATWGTGYTIKVGAMITSTAAGTTTFQVSQPEMYIVPTQTI